MANQLAVHIVASDFGHRRYATDLDLAVDTLEHGRQLDLLAARRLCGQRDGAVAGAVEEDFGRARWQCQAFGRGAERAEIAPVGVDGRSRRRAFDDQQGKMRPQLIDGVLDGFLFLLRQRLLGQRRPRAVGFVVAAQSIETTSDVELHVAIRDQSVRQVVRGERVFEALFLVRAIAA